MKKTRVRALRSKYMKNINKLIKSTKYNLKVLKQSKTLANKNFKKLEKKAEN